MCLILFAWRSHPQHKLLVAANRDEFYARPTAAAHFWEDAPHILAGRDLEQGGSWLGVTRGGRFAALTNIRHPQAVAGSHSRGLLVRNFLDSCATPEQFLQALQPTLEQYSPFNLLLGDGEHIYYSNSEGQSRELRPGIYGLSNGPLDAPWPKVISGKQQLLEMMTHEPQPDCLFDLLSDRQQASEDSLPDTGLDAGLEKHLSARFIHFDGYGTRCSTVMTHSHDGEIQFLEKQFDQTGQAAQTVGYSLQISAGL